jgi:hypothetical protein
VRRIGGLNEPAIINQFVNLAKVISERKPRLLHGRNALLILTLLLQYRKYESENPYVVKLSILDDELALTVSQFLLGILELM